jgi:hypothetical protein
MAAHAQGGFVSDDQVLQRALEDETRTNGEIDELKAQIAQHEQHLAEVDQFIATYRRYASVDTPAAPAFAYAD